jgi:hypothetical protein
MLGQLDEIRSEVEGWDVSLSDRFALAKACLLETANAQALHDRLLAAGEISVLDAAIWPLFEPLRRAGQSGGIELTTGTAKSPYLGEMA